MPADERARASYLLRIEQALDPGQLQAARERGARMTVATATEFATMATTSAQESERSDPHDLPVTVQKLPAPMSASVTRDPPHGPRDLYTGKLLLLP